MHVRNIVTGALAGLLFCTSINAQTRKHRHRKSHRHTHSTPPPVVTEPNLKRDVPDGPPIPQENSLHLKQKRSPKVMIVPAPPPPPGRDPLPPDTRR